MANIDPVNRNNYTPPKPPPPKPPPPPPPPPKPLSPADANAKRGEVTANSTQKRREVEDKFDVNVVGSTVAGARTVPTSGAEKAGFAPRTPQSAKAARVVADTINENVESRNLSSRYREQNPVIGAAIHKDGSITISASGSREDTKALYEEKLYKREQQTQGTPQSEKAQQPKQSGPPSPEEIERRRQEKMNRTPEQIQAEKQAKQAEREARRTAQAEKAVADEKLRQTIENAPTLESEIQKRLDKAFENDPTIKRNAQGQVEWSFGKTDTSMNPTSNLQRNNGRLEAMSHDADNCAAGRMYQSERSQGGKNPVVAADEVWRPATGNAHNDKSVVNNRDHRSMCPCASCAGNVEKVMGGNAELPKMTVRSAMNTGLMGAGTSAVASTLQQLWNDGKVDVKKVAQDAGMGGGLAIAGEYIEQKVGAKVTESTLKKLSSSVATEFAEGLPAKALSAAEANAKALASGRFWGAGTAGAVIGAGMEAWNQRDNFGDAAKRPEAVGAVVAQGAVGFAAGVAGAQVGAAVGTFIPIPVVGTLAGAAVGFAVGAGVSWLASATGADKALAGGVATAWKAGENAVNSISQGVSNVANDIGNTVSNVANRLSSIFG